MQNWEEIRPIVEQILQQQRNTSNGNYIGTQCFLTTYQIAVLVNKQNSVLKGTLPVGGAGVGPDSFARQIAWHLSKDVNDDFFEGRLEIQFFSIDGLDTFSFDGGHKPSTNEFSMFRLV